MNENKQVWTLLVALVLLVAVTLGLTVTANLYYIYRHDELQRRVERLENLAERLAPYMEAGKVKIIVTSTPVFALGTGGLQGYGGLEQIAWLCARGLAAKGHDVVLIAPDGSVCPGAKVMQTGPAGHHDERMAWGGYPDMKDQHGTVVRPAHKGWWQLLKDADAVVDHSWQKWAYMAKAEGWFKGPVLGVMHAPVKTMYNVWPPNYPDLPPVEKACAVCISEDQAAQFRQIHDSDARVCHNGVDGDFYKPTGVPRTDRFLFLARFSSIKGPHLAIEACRKAGVGLDLVGDTSITQEPDYLKMCQAMCDGTQIRMVGSVSRGEAVHWMSQAKAFLHPNKHFREPFGLAPVEAMLCGCPVIAWDYGAMRETVADGVSGYLVGTEEKFASAVRAAKDSHFDAVAHAPDVRKAAREQGLKFSVQRMVDRYEELVREAVEQPW